MTAPFADRLAEPSPRASRRSSWGSIPTPRSSGPRRRPAPAEGSPAQRAAAAVRAHCAALIDAAGPACVAVKPQLACFERLGAAGWAALAATVAHAHANGLLVIADGKRGDISVSAAAYGQALVGSTPTPFGEVGASAPTPSPPTRCSASTRSSRSSPRRARRGAGIFVLVRTSNPGAADVEDLALAGDGGTVWERAGGDRRAARRAVGRGQRAVGHRRRRRRHRAPSTSRGCASSCRTRRSCCPASARRAAASRTSRRPSRPDAPAAWSARRARSPPRTSRRRQARRRGPRRGRAPAGVRVVAAG